MLNSLSEKHEYTSFSVCPENFTGEKGMGGRAVEGIAANAARDLGPGWKISPAVSIAAGETFTMADIKGSGAIKHIWLTCGGTSNRSLIIRFYWDGQSRPAIEVPLGDFFASATREYRQLTSLAVCVNPANGMNCYWQMPYRKGFKITMENRSAKPAALFYQIDCEKKDVGEKALYFHAQFRRVNPVPYKEVYTILDNVTGNGQYVGTYLYWGVNSNGWWGEGEMKFFLDDDTDFPTICGTGTEDYFCGSYAFGADENENYLEFCTPYVGLSKVDSTDKRYNANRRFNMYRWHITDPIYFKKNLRVTIQALGWRSGHRYLPLQDDISSVAFWYSDNLDDHYPELPDEDGLEII